MSTVVQVSTVSTNVENNSDTTITIFDSFYNNNLYVNGAEYDAVNSYFYSVTGSNIIAANYAAILFRIAQEGNYSVLQLLELIKGNSADLLQLNTIMCYYLNTFKSKASLYGVSNIPHPNQAVQRNIVL